jgi:hypothetical protein
MSWELNSTGSTAVIFQPVQTKNSKVIKVSFAASVDTSGEYGFTNGFAKG